MTSTPTTTPVRRPRRRRITAATVTTLVVAVLWIAGAGVAAAAQQNPLDGVTPDLGVFGPALNATWKRVIAGIWGVAMAGCVVWVILAGLQYRTAKSRGMAGQMNEGRQGLVDAGIALGVVAGAGVITGGVLFLVGT